MAIATVQYGVSARDLAVVLAIAQARTLAQGALRLGVDTSTAFRLLRRIEKNLGQRLFERGPRGYLLTDLGARLVVHAEAVESELQAAHGAVQDSEGEVTGVVRISAVDAVLNSLVVPALVPLLHEHPRLSVELHGSNELANLTQRDTDIALRSTSKPPQHVVGKQLGTMRFAVFASRTLARSLPGKSSRLKIDALAALPWIGIDHAMPEHPGVLWRKRRLPDVRPAIQVNSMLTAVQMIEAGAGVGVVATFHAAGRPQLAPLTALLEDCEIPLWLLTHPESRHLRRISLVARHLSEGIRLKS